MATITKTRRKTTKAPTPEAKPAAQSLERPGCAATDRHADGRFRVGNPGGFGNPFARQVAMLRRELMQNTTPEDIRGICLKLKALVLDGNVSAAKLLFSYAMGKPLNAESPDQLNLAEFKHFLAEIALLETPHKQINLNPDIGLALLMTRMQRQMAGYKTSRGLAGGVTTTQEEREQLHRADDGMSSAGKVAAYATMGQAKDYPRFSETFWADEWEPWPKQTPTATEMPTATATETAKQAPSTNGSTAHPATPKTLPP
jgi:hypothetical protein